MSIFGSIMTKIFHHPSATPAASPASSSSGAAASAGASTIGGDLGAAVGSAASAPVQSAPVDVGAVLAQMASTHAGGGGNYQTSIVDLLRLLDMDYSLDARKTLAQEMGVHAGADGTAEQNIALHKAVVAKLAENGGIVPASMKA